MNKTLKSIIAIVIVLTFQFVIYLLFFHSYIVKWGATDREVTMPMSGDRYAETSSATHAIDIRSLASVVWSYLVDLGADRRGFYSYSFLEKMYGCEITKQMKENDRKLEVGRLIPYDAPDSNGNYNGGFHVVEVVQGQSFVLKGWGSFLVNAVDENNSRLIIRTLGNKPHNIFEKFGDSVFDALHFIMEKRMMLGIKDLAESNGKNYNLVSDLIWFLGIFLSGIAGLVMAFVCNGYYKLMLPTIFYTIWQFMLLILYPKSIYGILLVIFAAALILINQSFLKGWLKRLISEQN